MNTSMRACVFALISLSLPFTAQADTVTLIQDQCAGCHALQPPDYAGLGIVERIERKAPPLFYAGNKFREAWLVVWLQKPQRIRPAGAFPPNHVRASPEGDVIDAASLPEHPALPADQAEAVAQYLMGLRAHDDLIQAETYQPGNTAFRMGQMNFDKFKGCSGCHQDEPDYGGVSGPELYTAWHRLQPAFIVSYIANPLAWDPHSMMPRAGLNSEEVAKLANYLKAVAEE